MDYKLEFNEERHEYEVDGVIKPSVSQIIRDVIKNNEPIPEYAKDACERGTVVHKIIELDIKESLNIDTVDESLMGYYESFNKWKPDWLQSDNEDRKCELRLYNPEHDYCCTLDYWDGYRLIDWKTGRIYPYYKAQLGGYYSALSDNGLLPNYELIGCVQLFKDGRIAKEHFYSLTDCFEDWQAILRVYNLKKECK